jgi:hypothetical protein
LSFGNFRKFKKAQGERESPAINILPAPSSTAEKLTTTFLTRINDNPHTNARKRSRIQEMSVLSSLARAFLIKVVFLSKLPFFK